MGKKSKRNSRKPKEGSKLSTNNSARHQESNKTVPSAPVRAPASARCWVCLVEDSLDEPLTRDCSCRGDAGWTHMKCLVEYCKHVSDDQGFDELSWKNCNCCKQKHNNHVLLGISREARKYLADKYPGSEEAELRGLNMILDSIMNMQRSGNTDKEIANEGVAIAEKLISIAGNDDPLCGMAHIYFSEIEESKGTHDGLKLAIGHWEMVKMGCSAENVMTKKTAEYKISELKNKLDGDSREVKFDWFGEINTFEKQYNDSVRDEGADSFDAILNRNLLAKSLKANGRSIQAHRMATENLSRSRRVLGPNHHYTLDAEVTLKSTRTRKATIITEKARTAYEVLNYEEDAKLYVLKGPILEPRREDKEHTCTVLMKDLLLARGSPVICDGLENSSHLNGKLGETGKYDYTTTCYEVHFEDVKLTPAYVKKENLRVAFDFPPPNFSFAHVRN